MIAPTLRDGLVPFAVRLDPSVQMRYGKWIVQEQHGHDEAFGERREEASENGQRGRGLFIELPKFGLRKLLEVVERPESGGGHREGGRRAKGVERPVDGLLLD